MNSKQVIAELQTQPDLSYEDKWQLVDLAQDLQSGPLRATQERDLVEIARRYGVPTN